MKESLVVDCPLWCGRIDAGSAAEEIIGELGSRKVGDVLMLVVPNDEIDLVDAEALEAGNRNGEEE
jgi:hypothetical protein